MFDKFVLFPMKCSMEGLKVLGKERAFLVELIIGTISFPLILWWLGVGVKLFLVVISYFMILVTEALNTAIENIVNLMSPEYNCFAKKAKDVGSAAVFIAIVNALVILGISGY